MKLRQLTQKKKIPLPRQKAMQREVSFTKFSYNKLA